MEKGARMRGELQEQSIIDLQCIMFNVSNGNACAEIKTCYEIVQISLLLHEQKSVFIGMKNFL